MPFTTSYVWVVAMDVDPGKEELFNVVYDEDHVPELLKVPGVISVSRSKKVPAQLIMGGNLLDVGEGEPSYIAYYEVESPDVIRSDAWAAAVDVGRWADEVRPFTRNRHLAMHRVVSEAVRSQ